MTSFEGGSAVAIIPARGGSKRIPKKNIREFWGRPMIGWPIARALESGVFSRVVVSTDDADIARVAAKQGAEIPFQRDPSLADDITGTTEVVRDAIQRLDLPEETVVCCLYATAVFVTAEDLQDGLARLRSSSLDWVFMAGQYRTPIQRAYHMKGTGMVPVEPLNMPKRSQDLPTCYFDAGQAYFAKASRWNMPDARVWDGAEAIVLPDERCVDVDTEDDWRRAERLFEMCFSDELA